MRGKSTAQAIQQLDRLVTRTTKETRSKEDDWYTTFFLVPTLYLLFKNCVIVAL